MQTQRPYDDLFAALAAPFDPSEVKSRASKGGGQLYYTTARTVDNRLDQVVGPANWWPAYREGKDGTHVVCALTIRLPDGREVSKEDAGGAQGMGDEGDDDKSMFSDARKRAAFCWGIGRYLYRDGVPAFVADQLGGRAEAPVAVAIATDHGRPSPVTSPCPSPEPADLGWVNNAPAREPAAVGVGAYGQPRNGSANGNGHTNGNGAPADREPVVTGKVPTSGKGLFAWVKEMEQKHEVALLKYLNGWAKLQDFPGRMIEWNADQVAGGFAEAVRKLEGTGR
jgi:hypothetical protein